MHDLNQTNLSTLTPNHPSNLTFREYQKKTSETAVYPGKGTVFGLCYTVLGMAGEAGEAAEKLKKLIRDNGLKSTDRLTDLPLKLREEFLKEVGDQLWYAAQTVDQFGEDIYNVATGNIEKLASRKDRGTLQGSGDNR